MVREILKLGDPALYEKSLEVAADEQEQIKVWATDLHDTLMDYRRTYGAGRAIAAPQIGIKKRLIYMHMDEPVVFVNPRLTFPDDETYILMDDCLSFPGLMVRVRRHVRIAVDYLDGDLQPRSRRLEGDLAELLQHEYDHLDGILATMRALDDRSFFMEQMKRSFDT